MKMKECHGIIVDKSLKNRKLIKKLKVIGSRKTSNNWLLLKISFPKEKLEKMIKLIQESLVTRKGYYAHFYASNKVIVIFKDKIFYVTPNKRSWKPIIDYGVSLKIPKYQLNMKPVRFKDESW